MMKFVAFIRNINVGQSKFPGRSQLVQAFLVSGAQNAISFQSNGTVITELASDANLGLFTEDVRGYLLLHCNFSDAIFMRDLESIKRVFHQNPYSTMNCDGYPHKYVSYYECGDIGKGTFPLDSPKKDCYIFSGSSSGAYSIAKDINGISGYPTPLLERVLHIPVTTRSWTTIERLIARF